MITQYDALASCYDNVNELPGSGLDYLCVQRILRPLVQDGRARALDLACGTGRFTRLLRSCGADFVLGVDISREMIDKARAFAGYDPHVDFQVGDCSDAETSYETGPFDLVIGCWLLNYASSSEEMTNMVRHAAKNLKEKGKFVCLVPAGTESPAQFVKDLAILRPKVLGEVHYENIGDVRDGIKIRVWVGMQPEPFSFELFHLKKSVYEKAAKDGGLGGKIEWTECKYSNIKGGDTRKSHRLRS